MAEVRTNDFVVLLRISTAKTGGIDSNGIAAQRRDINLFLQQQENPRVIQEFVEVGSGAAKNRPVLEQAIKCCQKHSCALLIQKVDRLTRDVETLGRLTKMKSLDIKIASLPNADNFQIHLYGILGFQEREFISQRVRAGMREAKRKNPNLKFGNPKLAELNKIRKHKARIYAYEHAELIKNLRSEQKTYRQICELLNSSGIKTKTGKMFHPVQIHRILKRSSEVAS